MNGRSSARLVAALGLVAAVTVGMAGPAGAAAPVNPDGGGTSTQPAAPEPPGPDPTTTPGLTNAVPPAPCPTPDPRVANPGPGSETPDPQVTNPGLGSDQPCPTTENPTPGNPTPENPSPVPADGDPAAGGQTPSTEQAGAHAAAPTANLRKLADALTVRTKGITTAVLALPGLDVGPIEISFAIGANRVTTQYGSAQGSRHAVDAAPLDGTIREETLSISLLERAPGGPYHYSIVQVVRVEPLYHFHFEGLRVQAYGDCDVVGAPDPTVSWVDAEGVQRQADPGSAGGSDNSDLVVEFDAQWRDVSVSRGLTWPTLEWFDRDTFGPVGQNALPRGAPLLPRPGLQETRDTYHEYFSEVQAEADGQDCKANVRYRLTVSSQSHYFELTA